MNPHQKRHETLLTLVGQERALSVKIIHELREVEKHLTHLKLGFPSLFVYATQGLGYSEAAAQRRIEAMRAIKDNPVVEKQLETGELTFSAISQAHQSVRAFEKETGEKVSQQVRVAAVQAVAGCSKRQAEKAAVEALARETGFDAPTARARPPKERTLATGLTFITIEVTKEELLLIEKLREQNPPGQDTKSLLMDCVNQVLASREPKKPRPSNFRGGVQSKNRRHIPAAVKREVMARAGGQCEFVSEVNGQRCCAQHDLEYDHRKPIAHGGDSTLDNLRVLCRNHNVDAAVETLGRAKMEEHIPGLRS